MLRLKAVQTHIGAYHILHGVDLEVPTGQTTLLLGRNGAGKTTTLRTIMGLWQASAGVIEFEGRRISGVETPLIAQQGIAYVPENMGIFSDLTVRENLLLAARDARSDKHLNGERLGWIFAWFPAIKTFWNHPAGLLSGGQKQMLAVSRAVIEPRKLILIDEPSKGLAPAIVQNMVKAFQQLKAAGVTILLVEQNFQFARQLGDHVAVMDNGVVVHQGLMQELVENTALQAQLLGLSLAPAHV
jgi:branched-chain amino acid transport system ATP-binding protein